MIEESEDGAGALSGVTLPRGLAGFRRFLAYVGQVEIGLAVFGLVIVVVLSAAQSLLRYAFGTSLWWAGEIATDAVFLCYFLGISYVFKTRQYILIEFVSYQTPVRVQMLFYCIAQVLAVVFAGGTVWLLYLFLPTLLNMRTPVLNMPAFLVPIPLAVGSAMMVLTSLYYLAFAIWALVCGLPGSSVAEIEALALITAPLEDAEEL